MVSTGGKTPTPGPGPFPHRGSGRGIHAAEVTMVMFTLWILFAALGIAIAAAKGRVGPGIVLVSFLVPALGILWAIGMRRAE